MVAAPFGYMWNLSTHVEDLTAEEIHQRQLVLAKEGK